MLFVVALAFLSSLIVSPAFSQPAANIFATTPLTRDTGALITHTAAAVGANSADQSGFNVSRVICVLRVTAITGTTPTITFTIQNKDAASLQYYNLLVSPSITTASTNFIAVGADLPNVANVSQGLPIARTWRVITTIGGTTPAVTSTLGCSIQ
jgi:hypothetical protein